MKKEVFEKLLKDNGVELNENIKFDEIWNGVDTAIGGAIKNTKETTLEKMVKEPQDSARDEYIKSLNIEGVENDSQFKAHINALQSNEDAQELIKVRGKYETLKGEYDTYKTDTQKVQSEINQYRNEKYLSSKNPNVDVDYLAFKVNKMEGETIEDKFDAFIANEENKKYFEPVAPVVAVNTGVPRVNNQNTPTRPKWQQDLIDKGLVDENDL